MINIKRQRKERWVLAGIWLFLIYSTLYIVRPICEFMKAHLPFNILTNIFIFGLLWAIIISFIVNIEIRKKSSYVLIGMAAFMYMFVIVFVVQFPEEKIHLAEYGFLAFLVFRALVLDFTDFNSYFLAFFITAVLGWGDETIQNILPNRYYQNQDVILNLISGGLGLFLTFVIRKEVTARSKVII